MNVRFTYDINGILEAEATAISTGEKRNKLIINGDLSEEEKNERIKTLEEIKIQSENQNKDKLLIERANRIYAEIVNTEIRNYISGARPPPCPGGPGLHEPVADAPDRLQPVLAELAPQVGHVHVDDVGPRVEVHPPHPLQQLLAAEDLVRVAHEGLRQ